MNKLETRSFLQEVRAIDNNEGKLIIEGVVNKTGEWSKVLYGHFREKVEVGVFKAAINSAKENNRDIFLLAFHDNRNLPLASVISKTLELKEEGGSLKMKAELPPTTLAKDIYELIKSKVLREFSFGFSDVQATWDKDADGIRTRTITSMSLHEISIVTTGAYNNTEVNARELTLDEILPEDIKNEIRQEKEKDKEKDKAKDKDKDKEKEKDKEKTKEKEKENRDNATYLYNLNYLKLLD